MSLTSKCTGKHFSVKDSLTRNTRKMALLCADFGVAMFARSILNFTLGAQSAGQNMSGTAEKRVLYVPVPVFGWLSSPERMLPLDPANEKSQTFHVDRTSAKSLELQYCAPLRTMGVGTHFTAAHRRTNIVRNHVTSKLLPSTVTHSKCESRVGRFIPNRGPQ
jgi:hypothetical protein